MYMGAVVWGQQPYKYNTYAVAGERQGSSCPDGQMVIATGKNPANGKAWVRCAYPPAPQPVIAPAAPPPPPNVITVSPVFQQSFTPQVSPTFVQQEDSPGAVVAPTTQQVAPNPQTAAPGAQSSGLTAADVSRLLADERDARAADAQRAEAQRVQREAAEKAAAEKARQDEIAMQERYLAEQTELQQRALSQRQGAPAVAPGPITITTPPAAPAISAPVSPAPVPPALITAGLLLLLGGGLWLRYRRK